MHTLFLVLLGLACPVHARRTQKVEKQNPAWDAIPEQGEKNGDAFGTKAQANSLASVLLASNPRVPLRARPSVTPTTPVRKHDPKMVIGVPKVPYKEPGSNYGNWISLYDKLSRERTLFLGQQVDDEIANQLIAVMLYLESEEKKDISMYINSPGGSVNAGLAIFDTMRYLNSNVRTINIGLAASMGSLLLAGGEKGMRLALPHSRTMIHQPATGGAFRGQASDIEVEAKQILKVKTELVRYYSTLCSKEEEQVMRDLDRDNFMSAQEAKEYGLIDEIIQTTPEY